jgi:hypothetical protein
VDEGDMLDEGGAFKDILKQTSALNGRFSVVPPRQASKEKTTPVRSRSVLKKPNELVDRTLSHRYELKYLVSEAKALVLMHFVEAYLPLDRYCELQPGGMIPIVSLYLDSHNLQLCRESMEGHKNRFKLRIRSYTDDLDYPRFFEIKRRVSSVIIKARARVEHCDIASLLLGLSLPEEDCHADQATLKQFKLYVNLINAAPVIKIRYMRRAYEGDSSNRVRITFDHQLAFNVSSAPEVSFNGPGWQRYPFNGVILEIKFSGSYPAWLNQMVRCFDLRQQSFSKYALSVKNACLRKFCAPKVPARIYQS